MDLTMDRGTYKKGLYILFSTLFALSACGGGGGGGGSESGPKSETLLQGQFVDSPVAGLGYRTNTQSSITDEQGTFEYLAGETVEFFIGDVILGAAAGSQTITPLSLVPDAVDENDSQVVNILRFLQTLDDDGDLDNGIHIIDLVHTLAADREVNFDQEVEAFATDIDVESLVAELTAATNAGVRPLIDAAEALAHFRVALGDIEGGLIPTVGPDDEITPQTFDSYLATPGVWRGIFEIDATLTTQLDMFDIPVPDLPSFPSSQVTSTIKAKSSNLFAWDPDAPGGATVDDCSETGPEIDEDYGSESISLFDDDEDALELCSNDSVKFFRYSDTRFVIEQRCNGEVVGRMSMTKLTSSPSFNQGSLSLTASNFPSLEAGTGICGGRSDSQFSMSMEPEVPEFENESEAISLVAVRAPYQGGYLLLEFEFPYVVTTGIYAVVPDRDDDAQDSVSVDLVSAAFGGDLADPGSLSGTSGTVTVTAVSLTSAQIDFDINTSADGNFNGNFQLDLN